jgi:hypothetical protein
LGTSLVMTTYTKAYRSSPQRGSIRESSSLVAFFAAASMSSGRSS